MVVLLLLHGTLYGIVCESVGVRPTLGTRFSAVWFFRGCLQRLVIPLLPPDLFDALSAAICFAAKDESDSYRCWTLEIR
jgi:hypothetical protein